MQTVIIGIICVLGIAVSLKSVLVLGPTAPWTSAGWVLTIAYFGALIAKTGWGVTLPGHAEYVLLVLVTATFVVAGIRDERQAEPWWWPTHRGKTRAEKRRPA